MAATTQPAVSEEDNTAEKEETETPETAQNTEEGDGVQTGLLQLTEMLYA